MIVSAQLSVIYISTPKCPDDPSTIMLDFNDRMMMQISNMITDYMSQIISLIIAVLIGMITAVKQCRAQLEFGLETLIHGLNGLSTAVYTILISSALSIAFTMGHLKKCR